MVSPLHHLQLLMTCVHRTMASTINDNDNVAAAFIAPHNYCHPHNANSLHPHSHPPLNTSPHWHHQPHVLMAQDTPRPHTGQTHETMPVAIVNLTHAVVMSLIHKSTTTVTLCCPHCTLIALSVASTGLGHFHILETT